MYRYGMSRTKQIARTKTRKIYHINDLAFSNTPKDGKIYNVFLTLRFTTKSENKTAAIKEASERVYEAEHDGTIIGNMVSVLNKKTGKWSELAEKWYE